MGLRCCAWAFSRCGERGYSLLWCAGFSLRWLLLLRSTGSRHTGSVVVAHGLSCSAACGIFPDQGSNPCPPRWQADSQLLCHQVSPWSSLYSEVAKWQCSNSCTSCTITSHHPNSPVSKSPLLLHLLYIRYWCRLVNVFFQWFVIHYFDAPNVPDLASGSTFRLGPLSLRHDPIRVLVFVFWGYFLTFWHSKMFRVLVVPCCWGHFSRRKTNQVRQGLQGPQWTLGTGFLGSSEATLI